MMTHQATGFRCSLFCFPALEVSVVARFFHERTDVRTPRAKIMTTYSGVAW